MPQIIEGVQSRSASPFAQDLLNQAGSFRGARIRDLLQKKEMIFGELARIRQEREIKKQEEAESGLSGGDIGTLVGAGVGALFTGGATLPAALATIGGGSAIGGAVGNAFDDRPTPGAIGQGFQDAASFFADNPIFDTPKITNTTTTP